MMKTPSLALIITISSSTFAFQLHPPQHLLIGFPGSSSRLPTSLSRSIPRLGDDSRTNDANNEPYQNILPPSPKGVIFDMDGTLVQHSIDFADMRRRIYAVADADPVGKHLPRTCVLDLSKQLSPEGQLKTNEIFTDIEQRALRDMKLMPGAVELLQFLEENGLKKAVLTRNLEKNARVMRQLFLDELRRCEKEIDLTEALFHPIVARDTLAHPNCDEVVKAKPHPDGILHICSMWGCHPSEVIMVGDSAHDDVVAAKRAGCGAVLLTQPGGKELDTDSGYKVGNSEEEVLERTPSLRVESLFNIKTCLEVLLEERGKVFLEN